MKYAIIPNGSETMRDAYFHNALNSDDIPGYFVRGLWNGINDRGDEIHTIDMYEDWNQIDYVLIDWPRWDWIARLSRAGLLPKTIYCNAEPTSVLPENCPEGYKLLKQIYPYILTWNEDWVDGISIFKKNIPYYVHNDFGTLSFEKRKLLTAITANKCSSSEGELYSERSRVYSYFETMHSNEFEFYGVGWNGTEHIGYRGTVENKISTYHNYRFAICLENTRGVRDYVTEKIYDCLCAGIVPIYGGASNIADYVPAECFIDYFSFDDYETMYDYIKNMSEDRYNEYLSAISEWIAKGDHSELTIERYVEYLYQAVGTKKKFGVKLPVRIYIAHRGLCTQIRNALIKFKHRFIKL